MDSQLLDSLLISFGIVCSIVTIIFAWAAYGHWQFRAIRAEYTVTLMAEEITSKNQLLVKMAEQEKARIELYLTQYTQIVTDFFEDSPIQNYCIKYNTDGLIIKIGDDEKMVFVDAYKFLTSPEEALEEAQLAWEEEDNIIEDEDNII